MRGCDNFCSYCIVPLTRGRERSRPASDVLDELRKMLDEGFRDITLLGQNVNSYNDGRIDFPGLLRKAARIPGSFRLRFLTSHPKDLSDALLDVMASEPKVCPHLHLPLQSGSDRILGLMNRRYTSGQYRTLVWKARRMIPDLAVSTDVMVGFPTETEADFQDTCRLMSEIRFDDAYLYHFSAREGTPAARMADQVPEAERLSRLDRLNRIQRAVSLEVKKGSIGRLVEVIPENASRKSPDEWMGKTPGNEVVVFPKNGSHLGKPVLVRVTGCRGSTLRGVTQPAGMPAFTD
ncbi:MiaB/RimO family radical SAM methylthiotransferase, partial [bacterium]|nr:MiaB/RimO family radical SAM methylthiotransferase [bacterium]